MDNISIEVLLDTFEIIGDIFFNIINESLRTGVVPDVFKVSMVVPIPKINNTNKCEEFRPINMLPLGEKCTELLVKDQLMDFLDTNEILSAEQSGFRTAHSCESALNLVIIIKSLSPYFWI